MTTGFVPVRDASRVAHAVDVTDIRLHLLRAGLLKEWRSEVDVRAVNHLTSYRYAKDYDSIMTLDAGGRAVKVALEYERQPKAKKRYQWIQDTIESEQRVDRFLYLFPEYKLLWFVHGLFRKTARRMHFGLTHEPARDLLETRVVDPQMRFATLETALQQLYRGFCSLFAPLSRRLEGTRKSVPGSTLRSDHYARVSFSLRKRHARYGAVRALAREEPILAAVG